MIEVLTRPADVVAWIEVEGVRLLNVAGNRESTEPGVGEQVERFLVEVIGLLAARQLPCPAEAERLGYRCTGHTPRSPPQPLGSP